MMDSRRFAPAASLFAAFPLLALSPAAWSTGDELLSEADLLAPITTVTSATRLTQKLNDIPASVTVIDRKMIDASGAVEIADLMRLVPGFQAYHVHANKFAVTSHGQGDEHPGRLEVMIDGRSVYLATLSTVDWIALGITLEDIDRIEVIHGSNVPAFGSNAFLGMVNIITREPLQDRGTLLSTLHGSLDTQRYALRHNGQAGNLSYRLTAAYRKNSGTGSGFFVDGPREGEPAVLDDGGELGQLNFRGMYTPSLRDSVDIQLGINDGGIGVGNPTDPEDYTRRDVTSHYQGLTWTRQLDQGDSLKLQAYHNYHTYRHPVSMLLSDWAGISPSIVPFLTGGEPDQLISTGIEEGISERYDLELQHNLAITPQARLLWGAGTRLERLQSVPLLGREDFVEDHSVRSFATLEWKPVEAWVLNAGAMVEHTQTSGTRISPRLGLNHHLTPDYTWRISVSEAYRTPSLLEAHEYQATVLPSTGEIIDLDTQFSPDLEPERIRTYELGLLGNLAGLNASWDLKLFVEEITNAIDIYQTQLASGIEMAAAGDLVWEHRNNAQWQTKGVELQLQLSPWRDAWLYTTYGYADTQGERDRGLNRGIEPLNDSTPAHTLSLLFSQTFAMDWSASFGFYRQTTTDWLKGSMLPPYNRLDARLAKGFSLGRTRGEVALIAQNLLSPYEEFENNNRFDNRNFLQLKLQF